MTPFVSLLWKDVRGLRWELAGWLALIVAFTASWPSVALLRGSPYRYLGGLASLTQLVPVIAGILLAVRIVQADPLDGTTAGWRTRPLPRGSWVAAKLTLASALVVVPSLADAILVLVLGMRAADAGLVLVPAMAWWLAWIVPALGVGAITPSFPRAILAGIGIAAAAALFQWQVGPALAGAARPFGDSYAIRQSAGLVTAVGLVTGSLAVVVLQARTFRTARSRVVAGVVLFATLVVASAWRWDTWGAVAGRGDREVEPAVIEAARVSVALEPGPGRELSVYPRGGSPDIVTKASDVLDVRGLPDGVWAEPARVTSRFESRLGDAIAFDGWPASTTTVGVSAGREERQVSGWRPAFVTLEGIDLPRGLNVSWLRSFADPVLVQADEPTYARLASAPGTLTATIRLRAYRARVASTAVARQGSRLRASGLATELIEIARADEEHLGVFFRSAVVRGRRPELRVMALRNTARHEALVIAAAGETGSVWLRSYWPTGFSFDVGEEIVRFGYGFVTRGREGLVTVLPKHLVDEAWLADAELVLIEREYLGSFTKQLVVENYRLPRARGGVR